jgi:hypothetical protein
MLDQFNTLTQLQVAGDHNKTKNLTLNNLNKVQIGNFREVYQFACTLVDGLGMSR